MWGRWDGKPPATGNARPVKPIYNALDRAGIHDNSARRPANAELRLADMDRDGVQTHLIFGPIFQISTDDPVLRAACYRVFNDWLLEFCSVAPDRLIGVPMLPENPQGAVQELSRLVARGGVRQVNLMIANVDPHLDDPAWEPLWNALEASGVILAWHVTVFAGRPTDRSAGKAASVFDAAKGFLGNFLEPFVDLFAWGILERHPKLRIVMAEAGTGWLPWLVQELDYRHWRLWEAKEFWADKGGSALVTKPSELFRRQIWVDLPGGLCRVVAAAVLRRGPSAVGIGLSAPRQCLAAFSGRDRAPDAQPDAADAPGADARQCGGAVWIGVMAWSDDVACAASVGVRIPVSLRGATRPPLRGATRPPLRGAKRPSLRVVTGRRADPPWMKEFSLTGGDRSRPSTSFLLGAKRRGAIAS